MLLFVDKEVEREAKVLDTTDELRSRVPSRGDGPNHENRLNFGTFAAGFEVGTKRWAIENLLPKICELLLTHH
jgi:hypothetical protein